MEQARASMIENYCLPEPLLAGRGLILPVFLWAIGIYVSQVGSGLFAAFIILFGFVVAFYYLSLDGERYEAYRTQYKQKLDQLSLSDIAALIASPMTSEQTRTALTSYLNTYRAGWHQELPSGS